MKIMINDILKIENPTHYKLHLAVRNEDWVNPLDEYVENPLNWLGWNEWKGNRNDWTRDYIFSMMRFYPKSDSWLFGGVFKVLERGEKKYTLQEVEDFMKYSGRLIVRYQRKNAPRGRAFYLENHLGQFEVAEILPQRYQGAVFPGYESVNHDFSELEAIFKYEKDDWKTALSSVKGVYLICDKSNGKKYVGAAYGETGIWSRWACYIVTGHGWNEKLTKLINEKTLEYARKNFKFSLLEIMSMTTADEFIIARESRWKTVLLTREHGYNMN